MKQPIQLVTIAASAGGIPALCHVLSKLPGDYPAAVAIVQHRSERQPDLLARVLSRSCRLPVGRVKRGERLQPGRVYLAPACRHLVIQGNGTFGTIDGPKIHHLHSSANPLFETAAKVMGPAVVAVVLTGGDSDGTEGVQAIKAAGGTVIAQDQASSQCFAMPASAIQTGAVDYVLPLDQIGPMLVRLTGGPQTHRSRSQMTMLGGGI
jgi:two-component system chemotaxis response regulator CheB